VKILAGDIGGTSTRLAWFDIEGDALSKRAEERFVSGEFGGLEAIVRRFQESQGVSWERACFGIAGPIKQRRSEITNLPWVIDARELETGLEIDRVSLVNDLEANAYGIASLGRDDFLVLNEGNPDPAGNGAIISAGTGLGEAGLLREGRRFRPFPSEGGHASFSPTDDLESALLAYLRARSGHVSWERVLSGPGLVSLYQFLREQERVGEPAWLVDEMRQGDAAAVITTAAMDGKCPLCVKTLNLFAKLYGAEAGNLALKMMATGGVFVGGGIAPRIASKLQSGEFLRAFKGKGRMGELLGGMPVKVILNDKTALLGAALFAAFVDAPA
jgi:glucokinase